jgi:hypothetical protein
MQESLRTGNVVLEIVMEIFWRENVWVITIGYVIDWKPLTAWRKSRKTIIPVLKTKPVHS